MSFSILLLKGNKLVRFWYYIRHYCLSYQIAKKLSSCERSGRTIV